MATVFGFAVICTSTGPIPTWPCTWQFTSGRPPLRRRCSRLRLRFVSEYLYEQTWWYSTDAPILDFMKVHFFFALFATGVRTVAAAVDVAPCLAADDEVAFSRSRWYRSTSAFASFRCCARIFPSEYCTRRTTACSAVGSGCRFG